MKPNLLVLFLSVMLNASGQKYIDLANVYWRTSPQNSLMGSNDKINFNTYAFDAKLPIVLNDKTALIFGFDIANNAINNTTTNKSWIFSNAILQVGVEQKWNDNLKTLAMVLPKLSSNFTGGIGSRDFQFGAVIYNTKKRSEKFEWKYGAYVNSELFSVMVVPLFGFNWQMNEKWKMKTMLPVNLEITRVMNKKWIAGFLFIGANASYNLSQQINPNTTYPTNQNPYMDKADNNAWLYSDIYITKNLVLNLKAGHSVLRKYRIYNQDDKLGLKIGPVNIGDDRFETPNLLDNGWSFETRLIFRLPL